MSSLSGSRPRDSSTPGRYGSIKTSTFESKEFNKASPDGFLRLRAIEDLCLVRVSNVGGGGVDVYVEARSMRRTEAP